MQGDEIDNRQIGRQGLVGVGYSACNFVDQPWRDTSNPYLYRIRRAQACSSSMSLHVFIDVWQLGSSDQIYFGSVIGNWVGSLKVFFSPGPTDEHDLFRQAIHEILWPNILSFFCG